MSKNKQQDIYKKYQEYVKKDPRLLKIMEQLNIDQEVYLDALSQIENNTIIPRKIYSDNTY